MQGHLSKIQTSDGHDMPVQTWMSDHPKAIILICHGMAEHMSRYARLAAALGAEGYGVAAYDQRGHGTAVQTQDDFGFVSDQKNGWQLMHSDAVHLCQHLKQAYPELPLILLGHSMGSYLAQQVAITAGDMLDALILCGSSAGGGVLGKLGYGAACFECWRQGPRGRSNLLHSLSFESFSTKLARKVSDPKHTEFDWLSRDMSEVLTYETDPLCGWRVTNSFWADFLKGLIFIENTKNRARTPKDLPIYVMSGDHDPSNNFALGAQALEKAYTGLGNTHVSLKIYPGARHELFNEVNRDEVTADVIAYLNKLFS